MKKTLRALSIVNIVFGVLVLVMLILSIVKPAGFGEFLLQTYEDVTSDLGHTLAGLYNKIIELCAYALAVIAGLGILFFILDEVCYKLNCLDESEENIDEPKEEGAIYKTRIQFGRSKENKGDSDMMTKEERKAKKAARAEAKLAKKASKTVKDVKEKVEEKVEEVVEHVETKIKESKETRRAAILDQLRNKKR